MSLGHIMRRIGLVHADGSAFTGLEAIVVTLAVAVAVYSLVQLWAIERHERLQARIAAIRGGGTTDGEGGDDVARLARRFSRRVGALLAASPVVGSSDRRRMSRLLSEAGLTGSNWLPYLVAAKLAGFVLAASGAWLLLSWRGLFADLALVRVAVIGAAGMAGWRLPDFLVGFVARRRTQRIEEGFPDALDLLVISVESGLSLDQAIGFVASEIKPTWPELSREFDLTSAELRVLSDRREALDNLARRVGLQSVRSIVATLIQTMRFGTPLAQSLRVIAAEMRTTRLLKIEERAAQLPVLLSIPLMTFILPCTFIVVGGPAILRIGDAFSHIGQQSPPAIIQPTEGLTQ